jgi:hypothetical protein
MSNMTLSKNATTTLSSLMLSTKYPGLSKNEILDLDYRLPFYDWLIKYQDNSQNMNRHDNIYHIMYNLSLLLNKIRPSFLIQDVDYHKDQQINVITKILNNINSIKHKYYTDDAYGNRIVLEEPIFEMMDIPQGILIFVKKFVVDTDYYNYKILSVILDYNKDLDNDEKLGQLLGYPCPGDTCKIKSYLGTIILKVDNGLDIMANVCCKETKSKFEKFSNYYKGYQDFSLIAEFLNEKRKTIYSWKFLPKITVLA